MKYQLVIQWDTTTGIEEYDELVAAEREIEKALGTTALVDGHDMGSGERNIFILCDDPKSVHGALCRKGLLSWGWRSDYRAAYRALDSNEFSILHPSDLKKFTVK